MTDLSDDMSLAVPSTCAPRPTADRIAQETQVIPVAMQVLPKLKALLRESSSSIFPIISLLRLDLGLTVKILRASNHDDHRGNKNRTFEEAVHRLGYNQVYDIVSYAVESQVLNRPVQTYRLEVDDLWHRSITCALAAKLLAGQCWVDREEAYTIGLLHNIGLVAIDNWVSKHQSGTVYVDQGFPDEWSHHEMAHLGLAQSEVGAALLTRWDFPKSITVPIRRQGNPSRSSTYRKMVNVLLISRWVRTMICDTFDEAPASPDDQVLNLVGVNSRILNGITNQVRATLFQINRLLEIKQPDFKEMAFPGRR